MIASPINKHLLPFEAGALAALRSRLPAHLGLRFDAQVESINRVQRLLDWKSIEFYRMSWFRVRWPDSLLFDCRSEQCLATLDCTFADQQVQIAVWAVGGHVFSLEAERGLKPMHYMKPFKVLRVDIPAS